MSQNRPKIQRPSFRPFNSITIPRVQPKNQTRQLYKSSLLLVPISTGGIQTNNNPYTCSSSTPFNGDFFHFSKILLECKTFFEKEKRSLFVIEKQSKKDCEKQPCFERFNFMINNHQFLSSMPENYFNDLTQTISTIFNSIPDQTIPPALIYSDLPVYMRYTHFEEMSTIYNIFSVILNKLDTRDLEPWLTTNFIKRFIKRIDNPDISERKILEGLINQISTILPSQRFFILNCLFNLLQDHIDKIIPYFCVNSALQCISNIISFPDVKVTEYQKSIILYLLNSYFLDRFSWDIGTIFKKLYDLYPDYSEKVRTFLIFNWPNKDSQNSYYFLSFYISSLFRSNFIENNSSTSTTKNNYSIIVSKFYDCILSDNASNSLQAINFASNPIVYKVMVKISPNFYDNFFKTLEKVKTTWNPYINQAIVENSKKIKELIESTPNNDTTNGTSNNASNLKKENKKKTNKKLSWEDVKKMANGNL